MRNSPGRSEYKCDLVETLGFEVESPGPDTKLAWDFLNWIVPGGAFSVWFVDQNRNGSGFHKHFTLEEFKDFDAYVRNLNSAGTRYNVHFDPNSAGYCGQTERGNSNCFDYIALGLEHASATLEISELQQEIHEDMLFPRRRPFGIPLPTALWNTDDGCAALWRMNKPMGLSQGLGSGPIN